MNIGALVLYKGKAAVIAAAGNGEKIDIRCSDGESRSVRMKDVEIIHPGPVASLNFSSPAEPRWEEIVELAEDGPLSFADFTLLAYDENTPAAAWAAWKVLQEGIWFTGSPSEGVRVQTPETRAELLRKKDEKENKRKLHEELIARIRANAVNSGDLKFLKQIEAVGNGECDSSVLMRDLGLEATPQKAHALLCRLGVWEELYDPWPARLGVEIKMPESSLEETPEETREDLTGTPCYAIDDAGSCDPDDAVAFRDGLLYVHVADPAGTVRPGTAADEEASWRGESSYLPELLAPMLPEEATARFGLGLRESSPAMTFAVRIDECGIPHLERISLSLVRAGRYSYESASGIMGSPEFRAMDEALRRFKERRAADGALFIRLPEVKTRVRDGEISITPAPLTPERELVANAMLCAGAAVAAFMAEEGVPFPFVTQAAPELPPGEFPETMAGMFQLRRACAAGVTGVVPGRHSGLGLAPYSRVTSPLRRYADLLSHQQIRRYLAREPLLELDYISTRLARAEEAGNLRKKLEKYANEYYLLHYLKRHPEWSGTGTVVEKQGERLSILIPEFAYCYKCRLRTDLREGDEVLLKFNSADPVELRLNMQFRNLQGNGSISGL